MLASKHKLEAPGKNLIVISDDLALHLAKLGFARWLGGWAQRFEIDYRKHWDK